MSKSRGDNSMGPSGRPKNGASKPTSRPYRLSRWLAALLGATLALLAVRYWLLDRLPKDQVHRQEFSFIAEGMPDVDWQWPLFVDQQELDLRKLANVMSVELDNYTSVLPVRDRYSFVFTLRCPQDREDLMDDFDSVVDAYILQRKEIQTQSLAESNAADTDGQIDPCEKSLRDWLKKQGERFDILQQQTTILQTEYSALSVDRAGLNDQITDKKATFGQPAFNEYIKPHLEKTIAEDQELKQLKKELADLRSAIADLDIQAGKTNSAEQLEQLDRKRDEINYRCHQLDQKVELRINRLTIRTKQDLFDGYCKKIKEKIQDKVAQMKKNSRQRDELIKMIEQIDAQVDFVKSFLPAGPADEPAEKREKTAKKQKKMVISDVFCPALDEPIAAYESLSSYSQLAYTVVAIAILVGAGLGLILCPSGKIRAPASRPDNSEHPEIVVKHPGELAAKPIGQPQNEDISAEYEDQLPLTANENEPAETGLSDRLKPDRSVGWEPRYDKMADLVEQLKPDMSSVTTDLPVRVPIIVISAVTPSDASPRAAVNLSISLIKKGLQVLLVEADQHSIDLASVFDTSQQLTPLADHPGFGQWRRGSAYLHEIVWETQLAGLFFMPAGNISAEQADSDKKIHLANQVAKLPAQLVESLGSFDVVLIYSPAALTVAPETPEQIAAANLLPISDGLFGLTFSGDEIERKTREITNLQIGKKPPLLGIINWG